MSNPNQENERFRKDNSEGNQSEQNIQHQSGNQQMQNPGNAENLSRENQAQDQEKQFKHQGAQDSNTQNSNENSASGANKGPTASYNEGGSNLQSRNQREEDSESFTGEHDAQLGTQSRAGNRDESGNTTRNLDDEL